MKPQYEPGIPVPRASGHLGIAEILRNMPAGKSYLFKGVKAKSVHQSIQYLRRKSDRGFVLRTIGKNVRVWRTK